MATAKNGQIVAAAPSGPVAEVLTPYDQGRFNLALPIAEIDSVPPMYRISVRVVKVDPKKDTYEIPGSQKRGLGKNALNRLSMAASVNWDPMRSGQVDTYNHPHHVKYRAVGLIRSLDGSTRVVSDGKEIDLRGEKGWNEEDLGNDAREIVRVASRKNRDPWPQIIQQRQHIHAMAETKSKLRALRQMLAIPTSMDPEDIAKPWVVLQLVPDLDYSDPEIRRMAAASALSGQQALYGPPGPQQAPPRVDELPTLVENHEDVSDAPSDAPPLPSGGEDPFGKEPDPFGEALSPVTLPLDAESFEVACGDDEERRLYFAWVNRYAAELLNSGRRGVVEELTPDNFDPSKMSLDDIADLGRKLRAVLEGGDA